MPSFGSYGFSATKPQAQAYRQQTPAPQPAASMPAYAQASGAAQPAASMPAYAQASGAGAAQAIQPPSQAASQRATTDPIGFSGLARKKQLPYVMRTRESRLVGASPEEREAANALWDLQDADEAASKTLPVDQWRKYNDAVAAASEKYNLTRGPSDQQYAAMDQDQKDAVAWKQTVRAETGRGESPSSTLDQYRERLRADREAEAGRKAEQESRRTAARNKYERQEGMSDAAFDYLVDQMESGERIWSRPSYQVWQELNTNGGPRANLPEAAAQQLYLENTRNAKDVSETERRSINVGNRLHYMPSEHFDWRPFENKIKKKPAYAQASGAGAAQAIQPAAASTTPEQQAENARQMANWNKAREEATANGIDFATGRPLKEVNAPGNSGAYVVNAAGQPVSIASQREKAAAEGWDYDTGKWLTTQAADADKQRRTDALIKRLG